MDATKKVMMAGSLILIWAALAVWQWNLLEAPVRVPLTNVTGPGTGGRQSDGRGAGLHVNLSLLKATAMERDATYMMPRNIFSMTSVEGTLPVSSDVVVPDQEETQATESLTDQGGVAESGPIKYLGFLRMGEGVTTSQSVAVLRKDDDVLVLKAGDRIDNRLVLKKITPENVTVRDSGAQVDRMVGLSDEAEAQE
ncbi:MAG: hypothetical protein CCU26_13980 [Nitrospira sp. UW-LDO-01]|nr:MAG: hypothetical protein CCU26_13980 [Nitrospira sp. UW-LDO-01]